MFTELVLEEQTLSSDTKAPHQPLRYKIPNVVDHDPLSPLASDEETEEEQILKKEIRLHSNYP